MDLVQYSEVESMVWVIRNKEVIADADVAIVFGVIHERSQPSRNKQSGKIQN